MQNESRDGITVQSDRRWAMVQDDVVVGVILWDGNEATFTPPFPVVELDAGSPVGPDWTYDGETFSPPVEPESETL